MRDVLRLQGNQLLHELVEQLQYVDLHHSNLLNGIFITFVNPNMHKKLTVSIFNFASFSPSVCSSLASLDPDFIAMCENLAVCPRTKTAKALFKSLTVSPTKGPQGTTFNINVEYTVTSQIGTGMIIVQINPPDAEPMQWSETLVSLTPATYSVQLTVNAQPSQGTLLTL